MALGPIDIAVFTVILGISVFIGVYIAYKDRKNSSMDNYFLGGRSMNSIVIGISLVVTNSSSANFISVPAEVYIVGTEYFWASITACLALVPIAVYFVPAFRRVNTLSKYEYLELRFSKSLRNISASLGVLTGIFYTGLVIYATAATLRTVVDISINWCIVITAAICIFYTTLGGVKAVMWTDAAQFLVMITGLLALFIKGIMVVGGFQNLNSALIRGGRHTLTRFDYGVLGRVSPLARMFGGFWGTIVTDGTSQQSIQRYQSSRTTSKARRASYVTMVTGSIVSVAYTAIGLVCYAIYESCDPIASGEIDTIDQLIPYTALNLFNGIPGITGLYFAAIASAALSTVSSLINSTAINVVEDFLCSFWKRLRKSQSLKVTLGKISVAILGFVSMTIAIVTSYSSSNIFQLTYTITSITLGPTTGLFVMGFFIPKTNAKGATLAFVISVAFGVFMFVGHEFLKDTYQDVILPTYTYGCLHDNITKVTNATASMELITTSSQGPEHSTIQNLYNLNFNMHGVILMAGTVILGYPLSLVTGAADPTICDPKLFVPIVDNKRLPASVRKFFRFGVPEEDEWDNSSKNSTTILEDKM